MVNQFQFKGLEIPFLLFEPFLVEFQGQVIPDIVVCDKFHQKYLQ